jgi:hypothetical protein
MGKDSFAKISNRSRHDFKPQPATFSLQGSVGYAGKDAYAIGDSTRKIRGENST